MAFEHFLIVEGHRDDLSVRDFAFHDILGHNGQDAKLGREHFVNPASCSLNKELQVMPICEGLGDILFHNGLIKSLIFLLIPLDKKGAGLP